MPPGRYRPGPGALASWHPGSDDLHRWTCLKLAEASDEPRRRFDPRELSAAGRPRSIPFPSGPRSPDRQRARNDRHASSYIRKSHSPPCCAQLFHGRPPPGAANAARGRFRSGAPSRRRDPRPLVERVGARACMMSGRPPPAPLRFVVVRVKLRNGCRYHPFRWHRGSHVGLASQTFGYSAGSDVAEAMYRGLRNAGIPVMIVHSATISRPRWSCSTQSRTDPEVEAGRSAATACQARGNAAD